MKKRFRLCALLCLLALLFCSCSFDLSGLLPSGGQAGGNPSSPSQPGATPIPDYSLFDGIEEAVASYLCAELAQHREEIDLSWANINEAGFVPLMEEFCLRHPEFFYVSGNFAYTHLEGQIQKIKPTYLYDQATANEMTQRYTQYVAEIVAGVPEGSDFDKLLYVHDYFVLNYAYDDTLVIRDAYGFFEKKVGVCQSYTLALIAVTDALGIESVPAVSEQMNHSWNLVKLDGAWYHVDVTWDDAASIPGITCYDYFLQSDAGLFAFDSAREKRHYGWESTEQATDDKYDAVPWRHAVTPICRTENGYYFTLREDGSTQEQVYGAIWGGSDITAPARIASISGTWQAGPETRHVDCYSTVLAFGDKLLYNTAQGIWCYDPATGLAERVANPAIPTGYNIYALLSVSDEGQVKLMSAPHALKGGPYPISVCRVSVE